MDDSELVREREREMFVKLCLCEIFHSIFGALVLKYRIPGNLCFSLFLWIGSY